jgi:CubicO group peptidase (beta-lactamase class C family)
MPAGFALAALNPVGLAARSTGVPRDISPWEGAYNRDEVRCVEMPSSNGIGTASSVTKLYGTAATGGEEITLTADVLSELSAPAIPPSRGLRDKVLNVDTSFSLGFTKPTPTLVFGSSGNAYGTPGFGGSFGFADPDTGIGFGYVMNKLGFHLYSDPRELALRQAVFRDVLGVRPQS